MKFIILILFVLLSSESHANEVFDSKIKQISVDPGPCIKIKHDTSNEYCSHKYTIYFTFENGVTLWSKNNRIVNNKKQYNISKKTITYTVQYDKDYQIIDLDNHVMDYVLNGSEPESEEIDFNEIVRRTQKSLDENPKN